MDVLTQHEIAEANHRILNPFTDDKLMLLGDICRLRPGQRQLDLACGKGEMLCRWAQSFGITGRGVDISEVFLRAARERASELGVSELVAFDRADAADMDVDDQQYDVVSCIGATWIGDGPAGTIEHLRPRMTKDGLMLIGEPFWHEQPPAEAARAQHPLDEFTSLIGTLEIFESTGMQLVEMVLADGDSWDRYVAAAWWTVSQWLRNEPDPADALVMRTKLDESRRWYLEYGRRYLGWGVFVLKAGT
jgi:cyclopropane fatty-acyl-phospholipid synthase-like methyltransferase